ncbi:tRNA pseudouridine(55) synthase TruB [Brachybacterium sp.]|uniref:tRNA pseudouridine(55) synthase TruB n=1 Tax=Brachybacterium sp. TaxID=1891286 RepID=UPI002ED29A18
MSPGPASRRASGSAAPHGILLVDKAPERTSHDVVARVRWLLGTKKVGHAGTLDPMATGLLVLGIGQGTRLLTYLVGLDKTYHATIRLGRATTTDDREGEALGEVIDAGALTDSQVEQALTALRGDIDQVPSTVSAIKIDGKRAYARARAGEDVQLSARPVRISRFDVTGRRLAGPHVDLDALVDCSSGTYVRALARDLGAALEVGGHLTALRRTAVGPFDVEQALRVPARGEGDDVELPLHGLGAIAARVLPTLAVDEEQVAALGTGRPIRSTATPTPAPVPPPHKGVTSAEERPVAALDAAGRLIAVLAPQGSSWRPALVVPPDARC